MLKIFDRPRKQAVGLITNDGRFLIEVYDVRKGYLMREKSKEAWGIDPVNQFSDPYTKERLQLLTENDVTPLSLWQESPKKYTADLIREIGEGAIEEEFMDIAKKANFNKQLILFVILGSVLALVILVASMAALYSQGKISMPWGG